MKNKKTASKFIIPVVICLTAVMLLLYFVFSLSNCSDYFNDEAKSISQVYALQNSSLIKNNIGSSLSDVKKMASELSGVNGFENFDRTGEKFVNQYKLSCLQFLSGDNAEYRYGESVGSSSSEQFASLISGGKPGYSNIFTDLSLGVRCVSVYCPVDNNSEIDGIIAYYPVLSLINSSISSDAMLKFYSFAENDGSILDSYSAEGFITDVSHNVFTYLANINETKSTLDELEKNVNSSIGSSYPMSVAGEDYIVSCVPINEFGSGCFTVSVYSKQELLQSEYSLYDRMIGSSIGLIIVSLMAMAAYLIVRRRSDSQIMIIDEVDPVLGCNTFNKFASMSNDILSVNRHSNYAIIHFDINRFTYVKEHFDTDTCNDVLRFVVTVIKKMLSDNETYGRVSDDMFVALIHISDNEELTNRIKVISALIANCEITKSIGFTLSVSVGVYMVDRTKNYTIHEMMDRAVIAEKINKKNPDEPFVIYNSSIRTSYLQEAEIESKMELALKNKEFKVFYQPKYNLKTDAIDGAEALVRWYDAEKKNYIPPDQFIPLFEVNGFVSKLDRFVFRNVCEYLHEATVRGEKITPISINVSRVTATKPDFLSYYISTKKELNIADGFLMIEFTESFAYENYDAIYEIVTELRKNGFHCSIDDFGSGYSSFSILKKLQMDELKLDKLFLIPGADRQKDDILLQTVISLGNNFNMKVTQEGVEDFEQLKMLKEYGCDVIQGYYYSKPIMSSDFIDFVNGDTSMNAIINHHISNKNNNKNMAALGQ